MSEEINTTTYSIEEAEALQSNGPIQLDGENFVIHTDKAVSSQLYALNFTGTGDVTIQLNISGDNPTLNLHKYFGFSGTLTFNNTTTYRQTVNISGVTFLMMTGLILNGPIDLMIEGAGFHCVPDVSTSPDSTITLQNTMMYISSGVVHISPQAARIGFVNGHFFPTLHSHLVGSARHTDTEIRYAPDDDGGWGPLKLDTIVEDVKKNLLLLRKCP